MFCCIFFLTFLFVYNCLSAHSIKYYYLILIILKTDETLSGTTSPAQNEPESNGNEGELHTLQGFRTTASLLDAV